MNLLIAPIRRSAESHMVYGVAWVVISFMALSYIKARDSKFEYSPDFDSRNSLMGQNFYNSKLMNAILI